jgi:hypothetical protein
MTEDPNQARQADKSWSTIKSNLKVMKGLLTTFIAFKKDNKNDP